MSTVKMYTDGACSGNPGPAGWVAVLRYGQHEREVVGGATESTNNRAELMAVIVGLQALKMPCKVQVFTDSQYVVGMLSLGWKRKANHDLLAQADVLLDEHEVSFVKVKGHSGHAMNERCDQAAKAEVERQRSKADFNGTVCIGCGDLARKGFFCERCAERLTPEEMGAAWAEHCEAQVHHD
jgi:ribonuclease HI